MKQAHPSLHTTLARQLLVYCPSDTWGGVEKNVHLRVKAMLERGHQVTLLLLAHTFEAKFNDCPGLALHTLDHRGSDLNPSTYRDLASIIRITRPDCLFVPLKRDWWVASACAHWLGVPNTVLYLGIQRRLKANLKYQLIFQRFKSQLLVNSQALQQAAADTLPWLNDTNTHVIYNGFNLPARQPDDKPLKRQLGLSNDQLLIGCAGRLSHQKGYDLLPAILDRLPEHVHIAIAGQGEQETRLRQQFEASGLGHRLHLLGNQADMAGFYRSLDLFLLCSRNEGMANVLNEAMSYGLAVVSTDAPGSAELLGLNHASPQRWFDESSFQVGDYGLLTPIGAPEALANALNALISGQHHFPVDLQRQKIQDHHSLTGMMDLTERLFFPAATATDAPQTHRPEPRA